MGAQSHAHHHHDKVKMTFECTPDERAYIKMLAAKGHMTLSDFILSYVRSDFPQHKPNKETLEAMKELDDGRGTRCSSIEDFWKEMGIDPNA